MCIVILTSAKEFIFFNKQKNTFSLAQAIEQHNTILKILLIGERNVRYQRMGRRKSQVLGEYR